MRIEEELKTNLIADVENVCNVFLTDEVKTMLNRCFEITIGTHLKVLNIDNVSDLVCYKKNCIQRTTGNKCAKGGFQCVYRLTEH